MPLKNKVGFESKIPANDAGRDAELPWNAGAASSSSPGNHADATNSSSPGANADEWMRNNWFGNANAANPAVSTPNVNLPDPLHLFGIGGSQTPGGGGRSAEQFSTLAFLAFFRARK